MLRSKAFTLIELLIVVAIIAILAVIAVPNFLEAQVRSKISRVKNDMHSLDTALNAYFTDYDHYPLDVHGRVGNRALQVPPALAKYCAVYHALTPLTKPVAYITSVAFVDPFIKGGDPNAAFDWAKIYTFRYCDTSNAVCWGVGITNLLDRKSPAAILVSMEPDKALSQASGPSSPVPEVSTSSTNPISTMQPTAPSVTATLSAASARCMAPL